MDETQQFRGHFHGRFRRSPGDRWMRRETWQYNSGIEVARIFRIRARIAGLLSMTARDTYLRGRGQMTRKLLGLVTVVDAKGPEFDVGELVVYLHDAVLMEPLHRFSPLESRGRRSTTHRSILMFSDGKHRVRGHSLLSRSRRSPKLPLMAAV
jgi:Family of unknown function (DUF6544)